MEQLAGYITFVLLCFCAFVDKKYLRIWGQCCKGWRWILQDCEISANGVGTFCPTTEVRYCKMSNNLSKNMFIMDYFDA